MAVLITTTPRSVRGESHVQVETTLKSLRMKNAKQKTTANSKACKTSSTKAFLLIRRSGTCGDVSGFILIPFLRYLPAVAGW